MKELDENLRRVLRGKTDAEIRQGGFYLGRRIVTREECDAEYARRYRARAYAAQQRAKGEC
jgi:hypothetical protein